MGYSNCYFHTGNGEYNAVWDEKLGLCYALVQCKCGTMVGVKVHTVQGTERLELLVGKVSWIDHFLDGHFSGVSVRRGSTVYI